MKILHSLTLLMVVASSVMAQLPRAGTLILSADGAIGAAFGGVAKEEQAYGDITMFSVVNESGQAIETTSAEYNHFNWSGEMSVDVFLGKRLSLGLNGGYSSTHQKIVAEENTIEKTTGAVQGLAAVNLTLGFAVPVEDNMYLGFKLYGGYGMGELTRVPTLTQLDFSADALAYKVYYAALHAPVDVAGPTAAFEIKLNIFQSYGLMGSIGVRYGLNFLSGEYPPLSGFADVPTYVGENSWVNHSLSLTASVGFGFKMSERLNYFN